MNRNQMKIRKTIIGFIPLLLSGALLLSGCGSEQPSQTGQAAVSVEVIQVEQQTDQLNRVFPALVESKNQATLSTIVMGTVTGTEVQVGDRVRKGDVLIRIKDDRIRAQKMQLEANRVQARANLENTKKNYNRIKNLYAEESATSKELDDISTMYEIAKANMEALNASLREVNEMLSYTVLHAPFDGIVSQKYVDQGEMASPGQPLVTVSDPGQIKITSNIPEQIINRIEEGMQVTITVPAAGLQQAEAEIIALSRAGDPASHQYAVKAELTDPLLNSGLKTGMFAELNLSFEDNQTLYIPRSALVKRGQLSGVFTVSPENLALLRWVRTGNSSGDAIEILSGLKPGETIVTESREKIRQGQPLNIL